MAIAHETRGRTSSDVIREGERGLRVKRKGYCIQYV